MKRLNPSLSRVCTRAQMHSRIFFHLHREIQIFKKHLSLFIHPRNLRRVALLIKPNFDSSALPCHSPFSRLQTSGKWYVGEISTWRAYSVLYLPSSPAFLDCPHHAFSVLYALTSILPLRKIVRKKMTKICATCKFLIHRESKNIVRVKIIDIFCVLQSYNKSIAFFSRKSSRKAKDETKLIKQRNEARTNKTLDKLFWILRLTPQDFATVIVFARRFTRSKFPNRSSDCQRGHREE